MEILLLQSDIGDVTSVRTFLCLLKIAEWRQKTSPALYLRRIVILDSKHSGAELCNRVHMSYVNSFCLFVQVFAGLGTTLPPPLKGVFPQAHTRPTHKYIAPFLELLKTSDCFQDHFKKH